MSAQAHATKPKETQALEPKSAIILLNMGGPTDISGVEDFLRNIFSDPLILRMKSDLMRKLLGSFLIAKRLETVKKNYQAIGGKSPLPALTFSLCKRLEQLDSRLTFTYAMRYAPPFALDVLRDLRDRGINDLLLFSMYPQFSTTTTKSSLLDIHQQLQALSYKPRVGIIEDFHRHKPFYELVATSIIDTLQGRDPRGFQLILSAHSLPQKIVDQGDPYVEQCERGEQYLREIFTERGVEFARIQIAYQSKVGPMRWLEPCTRDIIAKSRGERLIIYPLAFTIDNSETIYELGIEYRALAHQSGVLDYLVCPCLNDSKEFAQMIYALASSRLKQAGVESS